MTEENLTLETCETVKFKYKLLICDGNVVHFCYYGFSMLKLLIFLWLEQCYIWKKTMGNSWPRDSVGKSIWGQWWVKKGSEYLAPAHSTFEWNFSERNPAALCCVPLMLKLRFLISWRCLKLVWEHSYSHNIIFLSPCYKKQDVWGISCLFWLQQVSDGSVWRVQ